MRAARHCKPLLAAALLVAAVGGGAVGSSKAAVAEAARWLPRPAPIARAASFDAASANRACASCHTEVADEWRGSMHRQAWSDPVFQKAYAIEPLAFCRGCHAPEADPRELPSAAARDVGVACTTCHVDGGHVVGARATEPGAAAHAMRVEPGLGTRAACASCHQFDFPGTKGAAMQDTLREHARSSYASVECQDCHMPVVVGADGRARRSHSFSVIGNDELLRSAVNVQAEVVGTRALELRLEGARVGHAFPTGDMFRRLELRARVVGADGLAKGNARPVHLGRRFGDRARPGGELAFDRVPTGDTRVPPPGAGVRRALLSFEHELARGDELRWEVAYQRMDDAMAASFGVDAVHDEVVVASGRLTLSTTPDSSGSRSEPRPTHTERTP